MRTLQEDQIFRIDHFLGKDTVQSITAFRFANGLFEPIWNRDRIDHVQITAAETVGVEQRGKFYEATGALRDMVPNHMFSLLSMVAMEPPTGFDAAAIRSRKADLLAAMPAVTPAQVVRGQYGAGTVLRKEVKPYRQEPDVAPDSDVETYVAMQLEIDNWRWAGVPFYIRTGKHLSQRNTEIAIRFKQAPYAAFQDTPVDALRPNWLVLRIAPDEGISLQFEIKRPGPVVDLAAVKMEFRAARVLGSLCFCGAARVLGSLCFCGAARVLGGLCFCGTARVLGGLHFCGAARVLGGLHFCGAACVLEGLCFCDTARVLGGLCFCGPARVLSGTRGRDLGADSPQVSGCAAHDDGGNEPDPVGDNEIEHDTLPFYLT